MYVVSGGSYNYLYFQVESEYLGRMYDKTLDELIKDLTKVLHDLEWWQSADIGEETYRKTVKEFKVKWFNAENYNKTLETIIKTECDNLKKELLNLIKN